MNRRLIVLVIGRVMQVEACFLLLPFFIGLLYREQAAFAFLIVAVIEALLGTVICRFKGEDKKFQAREGFVSVAMSWIIISIFGAFPYMLSGNIKNFVDALFETVSGFTTTGASILSSVEALDRSVSFWRCLTNWIGGMGVLVFVMSILPLAGAQNIYIMRAESPGPQVSKFVPKVKKTASDLYKIYIVLTLLLIFLLLIGGTDPYTAVCMSMSTAGTGGFGILNDSCLSYNSYQQIVIATFMLLFAVNFSVYYLIYVKKFKQAFKNEELKWFLGCVAGAVIIITWALSGEGHSVWYNLKHAYFTVASIISSTGFATIDFDAWPSVAKTTVVFIMFVGACAGSTGGGLKVSRMVIYFKSVIKNLVQSIHPKSVRAVRFEGKPVDHETVRGANNFLMAYIFLFCISMFIISFDGLDFESNFTAIAATMNNTGPGFGAVGPTCNYQCFGVLSKIVLMLDMLLGRLEIFPLLLLFSPVTYKK